MSKVEGQPRVAVIGLGRMGSALADALIAKGFDVTVWNRSTAPTQRFDRAGIRVAPTVEEAAAACDVLVVCLLDHESTAETVLKDSAARALQGKTLVQLTTMTSQQARELNQWAEAASVACLEGQILNYPDDIREGRGVIVCAGQASVYEACLPILQAMASSTPHLSETPGAAAIFDKALFETLFPSYVGFLHGAALCEAVGVSIEMYTEIMAKTCFASGLVERFVIEMGARVAARRYDDDVKAALDAYTPAFAMTIRESEALGLETDHLKGVEDVLRRACAAGHSSHDFSAVYELFKSVSKTSR